MPEGGSTLAALHRYRLDGRVGHSRLNDRCPGHLKVARKSITLPERTVPPARRSVAASDGLARRDVGVRGQLVSAVVELQVQLHRKVRDPHDARVEFVRRHRQLVALDLSVEEAPSLYR